MAYASQQGRAQISPSSPQAAGVCDRCGFMYTFADLRWQFDWRGAALQNLRILVCRRCEDDAQAQLRSIVVPADPVPIINARPPDYPLAETDYRTVASVPTTDPETGIPIPGTTLLVSESGEYLTTEPVGYPEGLDPNGAPPQDGVTQYRVPLDPLSVTSNGSVTVSATFSTPHGLATNDQISVQGLSDVLACGMYSVTVTTATALTWQTYNPVPAASLLTGTTQMFTVNVGLPYGYEQIPLVGNGPL